MLFRIDLSKRTSNSMTLVNSTGRPCSWLRLPGGSHFLSYDQTGIIGLYHGRTGAILDTIKMRENQSSGPRQAVYMFSQESRIMNHSRRRSEELIAVLL